MSGERAPSPDSAGRLNSFSNRGEFLAGMAPTPCLSLLIVRSFGGHYHIWFKCVKGLRSAATFPEVFVKAVPSHPVRGEKEGGGDK